MIKPLDRKSIEDIIALTPMQEGMLFHYLENPEGPQYVVQLCLEISGHIDVRRFEKAWDLAAADNQMLRTLFRWEKVEEPVQVVLKEPRIRSRYHDLHDGNKTGAEIREEVSALETGDRDAESLLQDVPFRVTLCKTGAKKYVLIITYHHILYDGWSNGILLKEFFRAYELLSNGKEPVRRFKTGFKEFVKRTRNRDMAKEEKFWNEYLGGCDTQSELSIKIKSSSRGKETAVPHHHRFCFTAAEKSRLEAFVKGRSITLASLCCGAWGILLQKYNNSDDVIFGTTLSGRSAGIRGIEEMVGLFINTLPLRARHSPGENNARFLHKMDKNLQAMETYADTSLTDIKTYLRIHNKEELFDSIVVMENYPLDRALTAVTEVDSYRVIETTHYDLTVGITLFEEIEIRFIYREGVFDPAAIVNLSRHFREIILGIRDNPHGKVSDLEIITAEEKRRILFEFNNTGAHYPEDKTIHRLFEEQVRRTPDAIAVNMSYRSYITYRQLSRESNRLAYHLHDRGIRPGAVVGIMTARSVEMIIGILGIIKVGAAYLPIDPAYPGERITYMLKDSGVRVLVSEVSKVSEEIEMIMIDKVIKDFSISAAHPTHLTHPTHPVYIIYTSGSTGKPRGVVIEHRSLVNFLYSMNSDYGGGFGPGDNCLSLTRITFDVSVCEIFLPLTFGSCLVLLPDNKTPDPVELARLMIEQAVTWAYIPPGLLQEVCGYLKMQGVKVALNKLLVGVEPIKDEVLEAYLEINPGMVIVNGYGPTEAAICATTYLYKSRRPQGKNVPIGTPLANTKVLLVDKQAALVPVGVPGELWISGPGLAQGYLNNPELTAEKFNRSYKSHRTYIFYKTGDLARWLPGGNIEFLGRIDHQVKIRGFRIELGEIEDRLQRHPDIKEAVVTARENQSGEKYLCAYVTAGRQKELREYLARFLPDYMVPSHFVIMEQIPRTTSGKVDRSALPGPDAAAWQGEYTAPRNRLETKLAGIWSGLLGVSPIGIDANFFQLGGHSLKATVMVSRVHKELKVRVPLEKVFQLPTVRELAEYIRGLGVYNHVSIEAVEKKEYYPLSPAQKRLYILQQMEPEDIHYNMSAAFLLEGEPDRQKLETAFNALVNRHESLRTSFQLVNDEPVQKIHRHVEFTLTPYPLPLTPQFSRPFDLSRVPLLRVGLTELAEQRHLLMVDMHHIISDGTSSGILVRDFMRLYAGEALAPLKIQYKDFSQWQNELLTGTEIKSQESYWLRQFEGEIPVLNLPTDFARPTVQSFDGSVFPFEIEPAETAALKRLASRQDATLYILLLAIFNVLLARLSGQEDIVVGSPVAGRRHADLEPVIGMFVNTLAMRNTPAAGKSFQAFLKETGERALAAFENQDYPFEDLVEKVVVKRDAGRNPLFDVMFVFQNMEQTGLELPGLVLKPRDYENRRSKFDLNLEGVEKQNRLCFSLEYNTKLFRESTVRRLAGYFQRVVKGVIANPAVLSADVEIIHEKERRQILDMSMGNREAVDPAETIHRMFEKKAGVVGDRAALVFGDSTLSYRELNKRSHQLAVLLHAGGVGIDSIVGLMVERSLEMIIGMLAIMKAGGAYLPIDPEYPEARKQYMIRDSRLKWLLTDYRVPDVPGLIPAGVEVIDLRDDSIYRGSERVILPGQGNKGSDLAYVIYTSGSTGMPKGVMLEHRNLVNLFIFQFKYTALDCSRMLQFATISFDASFHEIFSALLSGGTLCLVDRETRANVADLFKVVEKNDVKTVFFPMSFLKLVFSEDDFISHFPRSITHIQTAGEQVIVSDKFRCYLKEKSIPLHNHYGPSETHVVTTLTLDPAGEIPGRPSIGKPILNTGIYIVDRREHLVPVGVPGELYIGGIQVGRGYLNKPDLTAGTFTPLPLYPSTPSYHTGDLARWLEDGNIEFLGRIDQQVKIRGFRVELGEIEGRLLKHASIKDAVVTAGEDERGDKYLCAYITARGTEVEPGPGLKEYLSCSLPDYMVPSYFIMLDKIPLSPAGKVDRAALPAPGIEGTGIDYIAPRDRVEQKLVELWSELLGVAEDRIGIDDDFFRLGGHSLKATVLLAKIHKVFQVKMTLAKLFARPSVRGTADNIKRGRGVGLGFVSHAAIEPAEKREYYELSSAQLRFYMIQQMDPGSTSYNLPALLELEGEVDREKFRRTFQQLIKRHESLRTSFIQVNEEPVQRIHEQENYKFRIEEMSQNFVRPFDLSQAPLLRVGLVKVEAGKHLLMLDMHHIITDGTSLDVFIKEFMQLYEGKEPAPVRIQYKDFSRWQNNLFRSGGIKKQEEYWLTQFPPGKDVPVLNLPVDFPRPAVRTFEGADVKQVLDKSETEALKKLAREKEVTLSMVLFALFNILLAKLGDQEDIVVGQTVSGRRHADLQGVVGMFINILAMRNFPRGEKPFGDFLKEVKERTLEGFENQDYPFEKLVERAALHRGSGRNPLFDVEFVMQVEHKNLRDLRGLSVTAIPGLTVKPRPLEKPMSNFDLFLYAEEVEEGILLSLQYWTKLFRAETARDFLNYYLGIVKQVTRHPGIKIGDIDVMDEAERDKMLSIIRENKETVDIDFEF